MIVSPATLTPEAEHLVSLGVPDPWSMLTAHPDASFRPPITWP